MRGSKVKDQRRAASARESATPPRGRRWALLGVVAAVVVAAPLIMAVTGDDGDEGDGDVDVEFEPFGDPPDAPPAAAVAPPDPAPARAYRVVYRVEDTAGAAPLTSTDVLSVRLPYEARLEHRDGPTPDGEVLSATVTNQRFRFNFSGGEERFVLRQVPDALYSTVSVEALEAAVAAGAAERLGEGTVGGEACTRYRYRAAGDEILTPGDDQQRVETCVTPDSIAVSEIIVLNGRQVRTAEAVEVDRAPNFTAETFLTNRAPANEKETRLVEEGQKVTEGPAPEGVERLGMSAPTGFKAGRTAGVGRQVSPASPLLTLFVQTFERGTETVFVEELLSISETAPWSEAEGDAVELGATRTGKVVYRPNSAEVRVKAGDEWVRVTSARPELALAVARTLTDNPVKPS
jgi:hypothetical protein